MQKALDNFEELGLRHSVEEGNQVLSIISATDGAESHRKGGHSVVDVFLLYQEGRLGVLFESYNDKPRLFAHLAVSSFEKGFSVSATAMFQKTHEIYDSPTSPAYHDELLHAIDAVMIIQIGNDDTKGAIFTMHQRLDIISKWAGNDSFELANESHRLACLHSSLGHHEQCIKYLEESLHIGSLHDEFDTLDCVKLLATTYDAMQKTECAISQYEYALSLEKDVNNRAKLLNALSHCHLITDHLEKAVSYLDESLQIQRDGNNTVGKDNANIFSDTMILYGNAMSSKNSVSKAIDCYDSALSSNPDKSAIHPTNFRALYNKGTTLMKNRDIKGAVCTFETILDEVDKNPTEPPNGTVAVFQFVGSLFFDSKKFVGSVERFTQSLSLKNDPLLPRQRAGTLCNIATAYYSMEEYEEAEKYLNEALIACKAIDEMPSGLKASIMCNLACILYRRKQYLPAHNLFSDGKIHSICVLAFPPNKI